MTNAIANPIIPNTFRKSKNSCANVFFITASEDGDGGVRDPTLLLLLLLSSALPVLKYLHTSISH
jgi:hypothetical protein